MVTAAAFGPSGDVIALATAGNHVALFEASTLRHTPWSLANTARPPQRLLQMPGSVCGISFCPNPRVIPFYIPFSCLNCSACNFTFPAGERCSKTPFVKLPASQRVAPLVNIWKFKHHEVLVTLTGLSSTGPPEDGRADDRRSCHDKARYLTVWSQVKAAVLHTTSSLCHVDFEAPPAPAAPKRRRRSRLPQPDPARTPGANFRVLPLENPCLLCTYTSTSAALLVCPSYYDCYYYIFSGSYGLGMSGGTIVAFLHSSRFLHLLHQSRYTTLLGFQILPDVILFTDILQMICMIVTLACWKKLCEADVYTAG